MDVRKMDTPIPFSESFDGRLGVVYDTLTPEEVSGHLDVESVHLASHGAVPVGVFSTIAEGAASIGTVAGVGGEGMSASGQSNKTTLIGEVRTGRVPFVARRRARASDLWVWDVESFDAAGATCALSMTQVAVRPLRTSS
jgi:acyl-coenzyme A thioesterase PaaI-like protein